jgi:hypothetical protein
MQARRPNQDHETDTDSNGAETDGDQDSTQEHDSPVANFSSSGTYTDPSAGMTATATMNDLTNDSIGLSDRDIDNPGFASGSETPSTDTTGDTATLTDNGSDSASRSVSGPTAGGVTFGMSDSDSDGFTDSDHETDNDNGITDIESDGGSGSDWGNETFSMSTIAEESEYGDPPKPCCQ